MQRQHPHPSAHDAFVQACEITGCEAATGNQMGELELGEISDVPTVMQDGKHEIVIAAGTERSAPAIEMTPAGIALQGSQVQRKSRPPNTQAGADRGKFGPAGPGTTLLDQGAFSVVMQGEQSPEFPRPRRRWLFEFRSDSSADNPKLRLSFKYSEDTFEETSGKHVVIVDQYDEPAGRFGKTAQARGRETEVLLAHDARGRIPAQLKPAGDWRLRRVVDHEEFPGRNR